VSKRRRGSSRRPMRSELSAHHCVGGELDRRIQRARRVPVVPHDLPDRAGGLIETQGPPPLGFLESLPLLCDSTQELLWYISSGCAYNRRMPLSPSVRWVQCGAEEQWHSRLTLPEPFDDGGHEPLPLAQSGDVFLLPEDLELAPRDVGQVSGPPLEPVKDVRAVHDRRATLLALLPAPSTETRVV